MKRGDLNFVLEQNNYLKGGSKEACIKVREFLRDAKVSEEQIFSEQSCVSAMEFLDAVNILLASAFWHEDKVPETWRCDSRCYKKAYLFCPGEACIDENADDICPFFKEEDII